MDFTKDTHYEGLKLHIIIPTYNEKDNIANILHEISTVFSKNNISGGVIVVDDGSPDGTGKIVKDLKDSIQTENFMLELIERQGKLGIGTAYITGFKKALSLGADLIMEMDADFSHNPNYIPEMVEALDEADLVIGSRYISQGGTENWSPIRLMISKFGSIYSKLLLGWNVKDATAGFVCYRRKVLETLDLDSIRSNGYSFQIEMKYKSYKNGFKLKEIPIIFTDRAVGQSKMSKSIILEAMLVVFKLRFSR